MSERQKRLGRRLASVFYGWWIVIALAFIMFIGSAFFYYGLGSFFKPIVTEFGFSYAETAFVLSIYQLEGGLMAPVVGFLFDRFGPRRLIMLGAVLLGTGFISVSRIDSYLWFLASVLLMSVGFSTGFAGIAMATLANWFARRLTLALGVCFIGGGAGGMLVPALVWCIGRWGWRPTAFAAGVVAVLVVIPLAQLISHRPEHRGLTVDGVARSRAGAAGHSQGSSPVPQAEEGMSAGAAVRHRAFWMLVVVNALTYAAGSALVVHQIPYLDSIGIPAQQGAFVLALMTLLSLPGRVGFGWLADRFSRRCVMAAVLTLQALGVLAFAFAESPLALGLYLVLYGPAMGGGIPVRPSLQAQCFGRRRFGSIQGLIQGIAGLAGIAGSVYAGLVYDALGSYQTAFLILGVIIGAGVIPALLVSPPSRPASLRQAPLMDPAGGS